MTISTLASDVRARVACRVACRDVRAAAVLFGLSLAAFILVRTTIAVPNLLDLRIYRLEGSAVAHGRDMYAPLPGVAQVATYPFFAGIVYAPIAALPWWLAVTVNQTAEIAALAYCCVASCRLVGVDGRRALASGLLVATVALWAEPVGSTFMYGQVNLYLLALVLWDFARPEGSRWGGVGVGLATGLKVTPGLFIVYLVLTGRWRRAATAAGTFALTVAVSLLVDAHAAWAFWTRHLFEFDRVGRLENAVNQTIRGVAVRLEHDTRTGAGVTLTVVVVALVGLTVAVLAWRRLGEAWGLVTCAVTGLLVSPISWSHHWVWCIPAVVLLWRVSRVAAGVATVVFVSNCVWYLPHTGGVELHFPLWQTLLSGWYVLFGAAFLATAARLVALARPGERATARPEIRTGGRQDAPRVY